jgi:hypothetical protein
VRESHRFAAEGAIDPAGKALAGLKVVCVDERHGIPQEFMFRSDPASRKINNNVLRRARKTDGQVIDRSGATDE